LPPHLPKVINDYYAGNAFLAPFVDQGEHSGPTYRAALSYIAFFIFYKLIKASLLKILNLNLPTPPQNLPPSAPPDSSDPFVPFDPYDLSKNSPATFHTVIPQNQL
jgi:hypothetical protein